MPLRKIIAEDLTTLGWIDIPAAEMERVGLTGAGRGWWRIVAEIVCSSCGAHHAADSDPTNDKDVAAALALALFNGAGWRADERAGVFCSKCAGEHGVGS